MGRLIPGPYSTNKNLTGTCAENLTDTFSYSKRAGSGNSPSLSPAARLLRALTQPRCSA
jgi:hypothetical protein